MKELDHYGFSFDSPYEILFDENGYVIGYYDGELAIIDPGAAELVTQAWVSTEAAPGMLVTDLEGVMSFPPTAEPVQECFKGCSFKLVEDGLEVVTINALMAAFKEMV